MTDTDTERDLPEIPDHWTRDAVDLFETVAEERPDLSGEDVTSLVHAAELTTTADRLDEVARAADFEATGSQGQTILHPAVAESRQARTAAARILAGLRRPPESAHGSPSERARRAARARWDRRSSA
jgi:hypothetical protein